MRRVNEAWRVLGNARRRRAYDGSLAPQGSTNLYADTTLGRDRYDDDMVDVAPSGPFAALRAVPWVLLFGVLALIFVFTAYAATGGDDNDPSVVRSTVAGESAPGGTPELGDCVNVVGGTAVKAPCGQPNNGQVVVVPEGGEPCPSDTARVELADRRVLCLAR